jgi:hypothetical protein
VLREGTAAVRVGSEESDDKLMPGNEVANVLALLATHRRLQAMQQLRGRVPDLLDRHGLSEEVLIDKYLRPLLNANEAKFFPGGIKLGRKKIYHVNVEALGIRHASLRTAFELHGSYAPRDPKEAAQFGVKIIRVDIPRPSNEYN